MYSEYWYTRFGMEGLKPHGVAPRSSSMNGAFSEIVLHKTSPAPPGRSSNFVAAV